MRYNYLNTLFMDSSLQNIFSLYEGKEEDLIPLLQKAQNTFGFLSDESMEEISKFTRVPMSKVFGVATFYAQFKFVPVGKHIIRICHGTACHVQNTTAITEKVMAEINVSDGGTTEDGLFTLETVACIGCCSLAPVMTINKDTHGKLTISDIPKILKKYN